MLWLKEAKDIHSMSAVLLAASYNAGVSEECDRGKIIRSAWAEVEFMTSEEGAGHYNDKLGVWNLTLIVYEN